MTLKQPAKNRINKALHALTSNKYPDAINLDAMDHILESHDCDLYLRQEDGTPWSGFLCGKEGQAHFDIGATNCMFHLSWYTMPSGRYELVAYVG